MVTRTVERNVGERIEQICSSTPDATQLRIQVLDEIRKVVDYDSHVWLVTDPVLPSARRRWLTCRACQSYLRRSG